MCVVGHTLKKDQFLQPPVRPPDHGDQLLMVGMDIYQKFHTAHMRAVNLNCDADGPCLCGLPRLLPQYPLQVSLLPPVLQGHQCQGCWLSRPQSPVVPLPSVCRHAKPSLREVELSAHRLALHGCLSAPQTTMAGDPGKEQRWT